MRALLVLVTLASAQHEHHHMQQEEEAPAPVAASGTSWQPAAAPHEGLHVMRGEWMLMLHGFVNGVYSDHGGPRGDNKFFSESMFMGVASRELGPGKLTLRSMFSLDPTMGETGYPLLLQTGETLVDRQHPHDLFMELAARYDYRNFFLYGGPVGEPALGPSAFMMRYSGQPNPDAPLSHHWLDSTHITYGVVTGGAVWNGWKLETSGFRGREPDPANRWDIEHPELDSWSTRLTWNPAENWSGQVSYGKLHDAETEGEDVDRVTVSAAYHVGRWQTTAAWGRNKEGHHGRPEDALLLESAAEIVPRHTVFGRWESVEKHDLLPSGELFTVSKLNAGYIYDFVKEGPWRAGIGGSAGVHFLPKGLRAAYGRDVPLGGSVFLRAALGM